jgi:hypothetical protein
MGGGVAGRSVLFVYTWWSKSSTSVSGLALISYAILRVKPVRTGFHFSALRHGDFMCCGPSCGLWLRCVKK